MKKRMLALVMAGAVMLSMTAFGADKDVVPEKGAILKVWESRGPEGDFMKVATKKFKEKYGVDVIYEEVNHTDARGRLETDGPAGTGADIFALPHDQLGAALSAGLVMENLVSADRVKKDYMKAASIASAVNGKVYAWPTAIETYALFYNKKLFPKAPATFEELIAAGKKFTNPKDNKYGIVWETANFYYIHAFLATEGGYVFGKNGTDATNIGVNNKGAIKGIENMMKLKEISFQNTGDINYDVMMGLFGEGKAATIINGPWAVEGVKKSGVEYGIAPLPTFNGKHPKSFSGVRLMAVSTYTKYPKAAQMFAKFITTNEMLVERFKITKQIPPVTALLGNPDIANNADVKPFLDQAQFAVPMPSIPEMQYIWAPAGAAIADVWNGKMKLKESLDNAAKTIKDSIAANKK